MPSWLRLKSRFGPREPSGPPVTVRKFQADDPTLSRDSVAFEGEGWLVEGEDQEERVVRFFEVPDLDAEQCMLTYRARMRTQDLDGRAFLEMWVRLPGRGEFFSRGLNQAIRGTTDWASYETPFYLRKGQRADLVKLNLVVGGRGKVWLKDVELLKTPL